MPGFAGCLLEQGVAMKPSLTRSLGLVCLLVVCALNSGRADFLPGDHLTSRAIKPGKEVKPVAVGTDIDTQGGRKRFVLSDGSVLFVDNQSRVKIEDGRQIVLLAGQ